MYLVQDGDGRPIEQLQQLHDYFHAGSKPASEWRVGTEHEMIGVRSGGLDLGRPLTYDGEIGAILESLVVGGWKAHREGKDIIALTCHQSQIAIEPGGQLEHAARPLATSSELVSDLYWFLRQIEEPSQRLQCAWLATGFRPFGGLQDVPWMPKARYRVMRDYLPTRGALAHEMMKRTATVQVNLDFRDEADAARKLRAAMSVTSLLTAMYANSAIVDGAISAYQTYRAHIWTQTDPDRCGLLPFVFDRDDLFAAYTEWALDIPMFFVYRDGYIPAEGTTFRQFWREGFRGHRATEEDWALHLSTLFPEVRIKQFFEVRGCDAGAIEMIPALGALCRGFLYDETSALEATKLTHDLKFSERVELARNVERKGLRARLPSGAEVSEMASSLLDICVDGLRRQGAEDEIEFLAPLRQIVAEKRTQADRTVDLWKKHSGNPALVIRDLAHALSQAP